MLQLLLPETGICDQTLTAMFEEYVNLEEKMGKMELRGYRSTAMIIKSLQVPPLLSSSL